MSEEGLIFDTARRTIALEAETLTALGDALDADFAAVVRLIAGGAGRVVVAGVGKSALVAQKIAATLNSTGTPALFLHAADATHGDLGMVQPGDVVVCLSKSGETAEVRALAPLVRARGNALVAVVARRDCFLAHRADHVLVTPIAREADPHGLAPTASAVAQMALGDALAAALVAVRGFTPEDFARLHPGGALGRRLTLTLADLACRNACPRVGPDAPLDAVINEMTARRLGATVVEEPGTGRPAGIITDGDLRRMLARGVEVVRLSAKQIMTPAPTTMSADALAAAGLQLIEERGFNHLVLVDADGRYVGLVHLHDFVREGIT